MCSPAGKTEQTEPLGAHSQKIIRFVKLLKFLKQIVKNKYFERSYFCVLWLKPQNERTHEQNN